MNLTNSNITKEKFKHLSDLSISNIILQYNKFMDELNGIYKGVPKRKVPKRNINKTSFLTSLARQHNTSLSNIYKIIKKAKTTNVDTHLKEYVVYDPYTFFTLREKNKKPNHSKLQKASTFINLVVEEFKKSKLNSIDEIINDFKLNKPHDIKGLETVCTSTFYKYIKNENIGIKPMDLPRMVRRKPNKDKTYIPKQTRGTSIDLRDPNVLSREVFGHWEGDLVTGPRNGKNGAFFTLIERKTRFYYMIKIKDKTSKSVYMAFNKLAKLFGDKVNEVFKTITFDNGSEFARYKDIERKHKLKIYFAHPYASYERGSNEKCNQLIRYYIPKGTNINDIPKETINFIQQGINNKKRKILNYNSSLSLFINELAQIIPINNQRIYL